MAAKRVYGYLAINKLNQIAAYDDRLDAAARRILGILAGHAGQSGSCYPSLSQIADRLGISRPAVSKQVRALEKLDYLRREQCFSEKGGRLPNLIVLNLKKAVEHQDCPYVFSVGHVTTKVTGDETQSGCNRPKRDRISAPDTSGGYTKKTAQENIIKISGPKKEHAYAKSWKSRKEAEEAMGWSEADQKAMDAVFAIFKEGKRHEQIQKFESDLKSRLTGLSPRDRRLETMRAMEEENARQTG